MLGNPSDAYEGKAIAISVRNFSAWVELESADRFELIPGEADTEVFDDVAAAVAALQQHGNYGGLRLLRGAIARFAAAHPLERWRADGARLRFRMRYGTDIPRQVGLSGSSAIVIAALRALADWFAVEITPAVLAELALAAEVEELGIAAGPMDRVIQAYDGAMSMDLAPPRSAASYRRLDPARLPPLFVAWDPEPGIDSGKLHSDVRTRWLAGDPPVRRAMQTLRTLVDRGTVCLENGDLAGFARLVDENFDIRASIFPIRDRDRELIALGRAAGAATKFAGSGGAVVGVLPDPGSFERVRDAYGEAGYPALRPVVSE